MSAVPFRSQSSPSVFNDAFVGELATAVAQQVISQLHSSALQQRLFTLEQASQYIGRTVKSVEHLIARGTLPVTKLDGKRQIDRVALDKLIAERSYYES